MVKYQLISNFPWHPDRAPIRDAIHDYTGNIYLVLATNRWMSLDEIVQAAKAFNRKVLKGNYKMETSPVRISENLVLLRQENLIEAAIVPD